MQHLFSIAASIAGDVIDLFYPRICGGCDAHLMKHEADLCLLCLHGLPKTYHWDYPETPVEQIFWGRLKVDSACAFLHFQQENITQHLIHRLKYEGRSNVGTELGKRFATILKEKQWFADVDLIIPIPLHVAKQMRRGYNQSTFIANGISDIYGVPVRNNILKRNTASESQTRKSRYARSENVDNVFEVVRPEAVRGKSVLLVDDVVTTGATLEAAGIRLLEAGVSRLHIATLATTGSA